MGSNFRCVVAPFPGHREAMIPSDKEGDSARRHGRSRSRERCDGDEDPPVLPMPPTPAPPAKQYYLAIEWGHICDSCVAAVLASEWRVAGRPIQDSLLATACTQLVIDMRNWLDERQNQFWIIFESAMDDRVRKGMVRYSNFNGYLTTLIFPCEVAWMCYN